MIDCSFINTPLKLTIPTVPKPPTISSLNCLTPSQRETLTPFRAKVLELTIPTVPKPPTISSLHCLTPSQRETLTPFRAKVLDALCQVPRGKVTTYKYLSNQVNCGSSQAIGQALKHNPFAPEVPCHRVVRTDGSIGGFSGMTSGSKIDKKIALLKGEGVEFLEDGTVEKACIFQFDQ